MTKPCIGLVVPGLDQGGGVPAVASFVKDTILRSARFDLQLVSLSTASNDPMSARVVSPSSWLRGATTSTGVWEGQSFVHVGAVAGEFEFQRYRPRRVLAELLADCDVIQFVCGSPAGANSILGLGKPVALQVATRARVERRLRDVDLRGPSGWWRKAMTEITDRMDDKAMRHADAIQVENQWMLDYARKLNSGRDVDIRYAPPGVNAELFRPLDPRNPDRDPYILCVARLDDPRKNIGLLLEAYARLPESVRTDARLVLAGSAGPPTKFWQRADALGLRNRITYVARPAVADLVTLYQRAAAFVLPSDEEGLGMVLLEAMACGVPAVSTRSGGPDGVITDEKDGYLVSLNDASQMADRLCRLLQDPALNVAMGREARRTIEARYAEEIAGKAFVDVWDTLLAKAGKA